MSHNDLVDHYKCVLIESKCFGVTIRENFASVLGKVVVLIEHFVKKEGVLFLGKPFARISHFYLDPFDSTD